MELKTAIEILEYHQEWRLGKREDMIHEPKKLTEALDIVIGAVKNVEHLNEAQNPELGISDVMNEINYIYFEIKYIKGVGETEPTIENENALMFKPHTNSSGVWGFTNITERKGFSEPTFSIVEQNWVDLEKFNQENHEVYSKLKSQVDEVLNRLNQKLLKNEI